MNLKIIVLDLETTGLNPVSDEVLQVSIIDADYKVLLNEYCDTIIKTSWGQAESVHGISPSMVKGKPTFARYIAYVQYLLNNADVILTYNGNFDFRFLKTSGIEVPMKKHVDMMKIFSDNVYKEPGLYGGYKWQKLITCAEYYGYDFKAHDSLEDVKATLFCYYKYLESKK